MRARARLPYLLFLVLFAWIAKELLRLPLGEPAFTNGLPFANVLLLGCMIPSVALALLLVARGGPPLARIPGILRARPLPVAASIPVAVGLVYAFLFLRHGNETNFARGAAMFLVLTTLILLALRWGHDEKVLRTGFARLGGATVGVALAAILFSIVLALLQGKSDERISYEEIMAIRPHYRQPGAEYLYPGQPGNRREFSNLVKLNSFGFHDVERSLEKPDRVTRVLVLGDSFVEARQVPIEASFPALMERSLNENPSGDSARAYEVIPIGRGGASQPQELEMLRDPGLAFEPDLMLHLFVTNDVFGNPEAAEVHEAAFRMQKAWHPRPIGPRALFSPRWNLDRFVADRLHTLVTRYGYLVDTGLRLATIRSDFWAFLDPPPPAFMRGLTITEQSLDAILATCSANGIRPLIALVPSLISEEGLRATHPALRGKELNLDFYGEWLGRYCAERSVPFADLADAFERHAESDGAPVTWGDDRHWNETGHRVAAEALTNFVRESGALHE